MREATATWCVLAALTGCGGSAATNATPMPDASPDDPRAEIGGEIGGGGSDGGTDIAETAVAATDAPAELGPIAPLDFASTWSYQSGSVEKTCTGRDKATESLVGGGLDVGLLADGSLTAMFYCPWIFDQVPGTAMTALRPNQTCMSMAVTTTYVFTGQTFALTLVDHLHATLSSTINATYADSSLNQSGTCVYETTARLVR